MIALVFKDALNEFLKNNAIWLALGFIVLIGLTVFLILFLNRKRS